MRNRIGAARPQREKSASDTMPLVMHRAFGKLADAGWAALFCMSFLIVLLPAGFALDHQARQRGALAFHSHGCDRCHSITGVGGNRAPDLGSVGLRRTPRQIRQQILRGGHGMPPFGLVLKANEVDDLAAFLSACRTDRAPGCREWTTSPSP